MTMEDSFDSRIVGDAVGRMLNEFADERWFLESHWPLNIPHVRLMLQDILVAANSSTKPRLLDVGCFNGYLGILFAELGYQVTGVDKQFSAETVERFSRLGIGHVTANFNEIGALRVIPEQTFDVILLAQVIEHVLNHPLGLLQDLARALRPGGILVLTTPHPANVMNAFRLLLGRNMLWGTDDFLRSPKIDTEKIISDADIHYREYLTTQMTTLLADAGLEVEVVRYVGLGVPNDEPFWKRRLKRSRVFMRLSSHRLFASNHYFVARKR